MNPKTKRVAELMRKVKLEYTLPDPSQVENLVELGLLCVLARDLSSKQAGLTLKSYRGAFPDWNELRVSQVQEIRPLIGTKDDVLALKVAKNTKTYLQEVFQKNHGFDLEFLREDAASAGRFVTELLFLGLAAGTDLLWYAAGQSLPVSPGLIRVFDRLGLVPRTASVKKARVAIEPLVPEGETREFAVAFGHIVDRWCDARKPVCQECPLLKDCPHGQKVYKEWQVQQERLEAMRKKEEARQKAQAEKDEARRLREEERERKMREAEAKRRAREEAKKRQELERKREEAKKKDDARKAAEAKKKEEARQKVAAKKKAEADKKKAAAKKKADAAKKKADAAAKKKADAERKKAAAKKKVAKKAPAKKPATKKPAKKKPAKKAAKKTAKKAAKKPAAKKTSKKATTKKSTAKKATKKTARKR